MPTNDSRPEMIDDEALNDVAGGRKTIRCRNTSDPVAVFPTGVGDLKPTPAPPTPIPYPNIPNTKD